MGKFMAVVNGATLRCSEGQGASHLRSTTAPSVTVEGQRLATLHDHKPGSNVPPFKRCNKRPDHKCVPLLPNPWEANLDSGVSVGVAGILPASAELHCRVGGVITVAESCQSSLYVGDFRVIAALLRAREKVWEAYQKVAAGGDYISFFEALGFSFENMAANTVEAGGPAGMIPGDVLEVLGGISDALGFIDEREEEHGREMVLDRLKKLDAALLDRINKERGWVERPHADALNRPQPPQAKPVTRLVPPES